MPRELYAECVTYGFETDHHESDLYIAHTPLAEAVVRSYCEQYPYVKYSFFTDSSDRTWVEVPFHYSPHWHRT